ncbi:FecR family protein [Spirosoma montaniterrae]|uniref:Iron dicitrate transport regulator FecR n=1 Tax=Spirosoma montaniterrae TaxID=1178516 RepID=A0A1P9WS63_9BACT|nr:FecR family protein [Spirosoma montaniterrae]AQG78202.1 hypothetical protein AWR27_01875 [Spirosoma montaniterrae]
MPAYETYSLAELVTDDYFLESCQNPSAESEQFWTDWLVSHPQCRPMWEEAVYIIRTLAAGRRQYALVRLPENKVEELWQRIQTTAYADAAEHEQTRPLWPSGVWRLWPLAAAASIALLAGIGYWFISKPQEPLQADSLTKSIEQTTQPLQTYRNDGKTPKRYRLSDGSMVVLSPGSRLRLPARFGTGNRTVYLNGEGFFDVAHAAHQPFYVYANRLVTKVLGTRFRVSESRLSTVVSVLDGKVSVSPRAAGRRDPMVLLPNQAAVYENNREELTKTLVENPIVLRLPQQEQALHFDETPVREVFRRLETMYGITIVYDEVSASSCTLTATLSQQSLYTSLDLICEALNASYQVIDGQVVLSGVVCH